MTSMKYTTFEALELEVESLRQQLATLKAEIKSIGKAIDDPRTDLTMTMSEVIIDQKQQLAAALAACKLKDKALENCEGMLDELRDYPVTHDLIIEALAIQPDDSALKECLAEPVGWTHSCPILCLDGVELWINKCPHCGKPAPKGMK